MMSLLVYRNSGGRSDKKVPDRLFPSDLDKKISIPFNLRLPENISYLKLKISGIGIAGFDLAGGRQTLDGSVLSIYRETPAERGTVNTATPRDIYLRGSFSIKVDDPETIMLARRIAGEDKDAISVARNISDWVYQNIEKVRTVAAPISSEVLKTRKGDCNEHATLFTALARAAGIPARTVLGLVYDDGSFHYHSWAEILTDRWIAVDPTLGEFPADASHIRLIAGDLDKQAAILSIIGKIRTEGIEYR